MTGRGKATRASVRRTAAALLWACLLPLAALFAAPAQAQTTLVSNTGETTSSGGSSHFWGTELHDRHRREYTVTEVQIRIDHADTGEGTSAKIREDDNGEPGNLVATLTNPATLTGSDSLNTFTAPAGTTLDPGTTYWISVSEGVADRISYNTTTENGQTGEAGWTIGDGGLWRSDEAQDWNDTTGNLIIAIKDPSAHPPAPTPPSPRWPSPTGPATRSRSPRHFPRRRRPTPRRSRTAWTGSHSSRPRATTAPR